ncbi:RICIN domain-containing protein [Streptomyces anulatus]|nr:RICIN domain-containing protein [Streptomyces sp. C3-3]MBQ1116423.1 RICIN domain-containing protein [Streptomyces sp. C3-3]
MHSGKVLSVIASETEDGSEAVQWTAKGKTNQQLRLA